MFDCLDQSTHNRHSFGKMWKHIFTSRDNWSGHMLIFYKFRSPSTYPCQSVSGSVSEWVTLKPQEIFDLATCSFFEWFDQSTLQHRETFLVKCENTPLIPLSSDNWSGHCGIIRCEDTIVWDQSNWISIVAPLKMSLVDNCQKNIWILKYLLKVLQCQIIGVVVTVSTHPLWIHTCELL